jgi:nucleoside-diphosphate-sugar epimerase
MRILLTGATGFIGTPLLKKISENGHEVLVLSRSADLKKHKNILWVQCDLSLPRTYSSEVSFFLPEVLIHLAWQDIPNFSLDKSRINLDNSINLISLIVDLNCCKKIIVSGSCFELNQLQGECLETSLVEAKDNFTWAKTSLHSWLNMMSKERNFELMWMRIFYVYGPKQRLGSLIPSILSSLKNRKQPKILTPKNSNDFIYIDDVINAFEKALFVENASMIYNLGSGSSSSILEVCRIAEKIVLGTSTLTEKIDIDSLQNISNVDFWSKNTNSKKYLDWHPKTKLEDGIKQTWSWIKSN